ncbi:hypothetical protein MMC30_004990 [Trapelia coarctata]|nr:hypothetical protein [Trapelia coarctata]
MASVLYMEFPSREHHTVFEKIHRKVVEEGIWEMDEKRAVVQEHFHTDKEIIAYFDWSAAPLRKIIENEQRYCPTRDGFFERLRNTDYRDAKQIFSLQGFCSGTHMPVLLLGRDKGVQYKLIPGGLLTEPEINWKDKRPMMHHNVLGINLHIEPKCEALGRMKRRFHGEDPEEFRILHQIGGVMCYDGDFSKVKAAPGATSGRKWLETGFALASDVTSGKPGAVYLIYDFFPFIPSLEKCKHIDNDYEWGFLPKDEENEDQFSCAKIADSLDDLNGDYEFQWGKRYSYEVELVPAVQNPDGTLDRQLVEEPAEAATEKAPGLLEDTASAHTHTDSKTNSLLTPPPEGICRSSNLVRKTSSAHTRKGPSDWQ